MSGSRIKKTTAMCLAFLLSGAVLSQAAGPSEFLSGIWKKRPQVSKTRLNPKNWKKKEPAAPDATGRVQVGAFKSIRENLENDPFRAEPSSPIRNLINNSPASNGVVAEQSDAASRDRQLNQRRQSPSFGQPTSIDRTVPTPNRRPAAGNRQRIRTLAEQTEQDRRQDANAAVLRRKERAAQQRQRDVETQDLTPGFDALVQEFLAEREGRSSTQSTQRRQPDLPPSIFDEAAQTQQAAKQPFDASNFYETDSNLATESQRQQGVLDRLARERQFADIERQRLAQDANSDTPRDIDAPRPTMQIKPGPLPGQENGGGFARDKSSDSVRPDAVGRRLADERLPLQQRFDSQDNFDDRHQEQPYEWQNARRYEDRIAEQRGNSYTDNTRTRDGQPIADSRRFTNEWSAQNLEDLLREMQTDIRQPTDRSNLQTVSRSDERQHQSDSDLRLLGDQSPLVLSPQLPLDKHQYLNKSNNQRERPRGAQAFDQDWNRDRENNRSNFRPQVPAQSTEQTERTRPETNRTPDTLPKRKQIKMIITPRVTSNQAPQLAVPNNQQYRRMSYEEAASKSQRLEIPQQDGQPPFLMLPGEANRRPVGQPATQVQQPSSGPLVRQQATPTSIEPKTQTADVNTAGSLGPVNWGDARDVITPASASLPWMMMATIAVCAAAIISFLVVRTRKVGIVATEAANAPGEAN